MGSERAARPHLLSRVTDRARLLPQALLPLKGTIRTLVRLIGVGGALPLDAAILSGAPSAANLRARSDAEEHPSNLPFLWRDMP